MKRFVDLFFELDATTRTNAKVAALRRYFEGTPPADAAWGLYFLTGGKLRRLVNSTQLRAWIAERTGLPDWIVDECYQSVGDLAETMALLLGDPGAGTEEPLHRMIAERLRPLGELDKEEQRKRLLLDTWERLDDRQRLVWNKLITGGFRVGVQKTLVARALAELAGVDRSVMSHRLMGGFEATPEAFTALLVPDEGEADPARPYPFFLAHPLAGDPEDLGALDDWQIEWKWDGIRAQVVRRADLTLVWTRGEELVPERYPELVAAAAELPPGTVLDGEILGWRDGTVLPFGELQKRIGRKALGKQLLADVPVRLLAYDLLEHGGDDVRALPQAERRERLAQVVEALGDARIGLSPLVEAPNWSALAALREQSRERRVEGFMLKRRDAPYGTGRAKGPWWKWKVDPFSADMVLIYAQKGHGRRSNLYTDYTFGVWRGDELLPVAKAYSGLTDAEIKRVDRFVRDHTRESFGPVRTVDPELVFELHFEGLNESRRHKSGLALRFPRMARWREDKRPADADRLETLAAMLHSARSDPNEDAVS